MKRSFEQVLAFLVQILEVTLSSLKQNGCTVLKYVVCLTRLNHLYVAFSTLIFKLALQGF